MTGADEGRFVAIQRRYGEARERERAFRDDVLSKKYGRSDPPGAWLTRTERRRLDSFHRAHARLADAMTALLARVSQRDWASGAPLHWIMTTLTYADATTTGALSVSPPPPYGHTIRDMRHFVAPL